MKRRGFFAAVAAIVAAPKAVKLVPVLLGDHWNASTTILEDFEYGLTRVWQEGRFPVSPAGRMMAACEFYDEGLISKKTLGDKIEAS